MNILALDTSTLRMTVALKTEEEFIKSSTIPETGHLEALMPEILKVLSVAGIEIKNLDLLTCTEGPGSFTGLRIAMSTLKGISEGSGIPIVSIPTLDAYISAAQSNGAVVAAIDARRNKFYLRAEKNGDVLIETKEGDENDVIALGEPVLIVGPDSALLSKKILDSSPAFPVTVLDDVDIAESLIEKARIKYMECGADDIGSGPLYIRKSDAEEALLRRIDGR